jgi:hypothetical protein
VEIGPEAIRFVIPKHAEFPCVPSRIRLCKCLDNLPEALPLPTLIERRTSSSDGTADKLAAMARRKPSRASTGSDEVAAMITLSC